MGAAGQASRDELYIHNAIIVHTVAALIASIDAMRAAYTYCVSIYDRKVFVGGYIYIPSNKYFSIVYGPIGTELKQS